MITEEALMAIVVILLTTTALTMFTLASKRAEKAADAILQEQEDRVARLMLDIEKTIIRAENR